MFDLSFKEIFILAVLLIPLALVLASILCGFFYTVFCLIKEKFGHMHLRDKHAH